MATNPVVENKKPSGNGLEPLSDGLSRDRGHDPGVTAV